MEDVARPWLEERQTPETGATGAHAARRSEDDSMFRC